jgi:deoxyribodipyrimidine photo-lyase
MAHPTGAQGVAGREATRAAGETLLRSFVPRMGSRYAGGRNYDRGPGGHTAVSMLSPYLRRRLVLEPDVVAAAIGEHGLAGAEKFVQEILWRGYFKGWLEHRPGIWSNYRDGLTRDLALLEGDRRLRSCLTAAEAGETGLECFDAWVRELIQTGYLHNHARMWFASIWIFTFRLPWRLGADFFYRHLLDGDPASNTLSWRWVAGLHTRGKAYQAQAANIARYTAGRFVPDEATLTQQIRALDSEEPEGLPAVSLLRQPLAPEPSQPALLLITEEDCRLEDFNLAGLDVQAAATLAASHLRSPLPVAEGVVAFEKAALADAAMRSGLATSTLRAGGADELAALATRVGAQQIVTPYIPEGPLRDWLRQAAPALANNGIRLCEWRRDWDTTIWPHATAGFFKVKQRIPSLLESLALA